MFLLGRLILYIRIWTEEEGVRLLFLIRVYNISLPCLTGLIEVLEIVSENIGPNWTELAQTLGLSTAEISATRTRHTGSNPQEACWDMLCQWRQKTPRPTMVCDLQAALRSCRQVRVADLIAKLMDSPQNMDDILSPHSDREGIVGHTISFILRKCDLSKRTKRSCGLCW